MGSESETAPWTLRTATVPIETTAGATVEVYSTGWVHGAASFTTSTALTGGTLSVVTPVRVTSDLPLELGGFGRMTLRFVPEPGLLLLLASGLLGLLILGHKRMQS